MSSILKLKPTPVLEKILVFLHHFLLTYLSGWVIAVRETKRDEKRLRGEAFWTWLREEN
jgi:hypothetical protein